MRGNNVCVYHTICWSNTILNQNDQIFINNLNYKIKNNIKNLNDIYHRIATSNKVLANKDKWKAFNEKLISINNTKCNMKKIYNLNILNKNLINTVNKNIEDIA